MYFVCTWSAYVCIGMYNVQYIYICVYIHVYQRNFAIQLTSVGLTHARPQIYEQAGPAFVSLSKCKRLVTSFIPRLLLRVREKEMYTLFAQAPSSFDNLHFTPPN